MRARDVAFVRKLCTLGLPPQTLAAAVLPAVRGLISAHSGAVFWVDVNGEMQALYAERLLDPEAMARYYERHYETQSAGFAPAFRKRAEAADPVSTHSFTPVEQRSEYFVDVMAVLDAYHVLYGVLKRGDRAYGQISLYRGRGNEPFASTSADDLRALLGYLSRGLASSDLRPGTDDHWVIVEEALGLVDANGRVMSAPESWQRLLRLDVIAEISPRHARGDRAEIEAFLSRLCTQASTSRTQPFELVRRNPLGRFRAVVYALPGSAPDAATQFGVLLRREEPRSLALVRATGMSSLSPQQREVALLLAQGQTNTEIAQSLGLSVNTASYHVKQIFARLEVQDRAAVAEKLLLLRDVSRSSAQERRGGSPASHQ